jgi:hypothetical protein
MDDYLFAHTDFGDFNSARALRIRGDKDALLRGGRWCSYLPPDRAERKHHRIRRRCLPERHRRTRRNYRFNSNIQPNWR